MPNPDSDAGRALFSLETFDKEFGKLNISKLFKARA